MLNYCTCLLRAIVWRNTDTSNEKNMIQYAPTFARFFPAGHSLKAIIHFSQIALGDDLYYFKKFDYGKTENLRIYGSNQPQAYNLSLIKHKVTIMHGNKDRYFTERAIDMLKTKLENSEFVNVLEYNGWGHVSFIVGKEIKLMVDDIQDQLVHNKVHL